MSETFSTDVHGRALPVNGRQGLRVRKQIAASIVPVDLSGASRVMIRDISVTGAQLVIGEQADFPETFYLMMRPAVIASSPKMGCDRRWQAGAAMGVEFNGILPEDVLRALTGLRRALCTQAN